MVKKSISIKLDETLWPFLKNKPNRSRYLEGLVREDIQQKNQQGIYTALTERLLNDAEYLTKLSRKLADASRAPVIEKTGDSELITNDWGA